MRSICRSAGFSLIELMMVLVLVAIFASIAVPSFNALIERNRIQTASEELYSLLQYARSEAVNRHANVSIRATQNDGACFNASDSTLCTYSVRSEL